MKLNRRRFLESGSQGAIALAAAGNPAISLPLSWNEAGLPIGSMFAAKYGQESLLLSLAYQLEEANPWADKRPLL